MDFFPPVRCKLLVETAQGVPPRRGAVGLRQYPRAVRKLNTIYGVGLSGPLVAAAAVQLAFDDRAGPSSDFYVAVAGIVPVLLLALMVELVGGIGRDHRRDLDSLAQVSRGLAKVASDMDEMERTAERLAPAVDMGVLRAERDVEERIRATVDDARAISRDTAVRARRLVRLFFRMAALAEAAALYGIGAGRSSPFLATACVGYLLTLALVLLQVYEQRFDEPA